MNKIDLSSIKPCLACGSTNIRLESIRAPGRLSDFWRVICSCSQASKQWSVSEGAAIRAWNRSLAENVPKYEQKNK